MWITFMGLGNTRSTQNVPCKTENVQFNKTVYLLKYMLQNE